MRIKLTPVKAPYYNKFVVEFKDFYGDGDVHIVGYQDYPVDSIIDSAIVGKLIESFDAMKEYKNDPRKFPSLIPHWEDEDIYLYDIIPYNADMFDQHLQIEKYSIMYYDYSGNKFLVERG